MRLNAGSLVVATLGSLALLATAARAQVVINVADGASLSAAINTVDTVPSASGYIIKFQNNITLTSAASNTLTAFNTTSNVTVNGNGFTLNGGGVQRGFFVYSGNVAISNIAITKTLAQGGAGGSGGAGGGGAGLGGALFVASGGSVTVSNVSLTSNAAIGGAGSAGSLGIVFGGGGGGWAARAALPAPAAAAAAESASPLPAGWAAASAGALAL
jgi:hypothetical protein